MTIDHLIIHACDGIMSPNERSRYGIGRRADGDGPKGQGDEGGKKNIHWINKIFNMTHLTSFLLNVFLVFVFIDDLPNYALWGDENSSQKCHGSNCVCTLDDCIGLFGARADKLSEWERSGQQFARLIMLTAGESPQRRFFPTRVMWERLRVDFMSSIFILLYVFAIFRLRITMQQMDEHFYDIGHASGPLQSAKA